MPARVLVPLPDHDFDVTEVAVPWHALTDAGCEVQFADIAPDTVDDSSPAFLVEDGRYLSARWPGDAYAFGRRFTEMVLSSV